MLECQLPLDLFNRESPTFAGSIASPAVGPTVIAVNDVDIPCRAEFYSKDMVGANFLVTQIVDPGFSKVPYANVNNKTVMGDRPKPLAEFLKTEEPDGRQSTSKSKLRCYAYLIKKGKQKDKGPRIDGTDSNINDGVPVSYNIETGMVLRCMMKKAGAIGGADREKRESFFPQDLDVIPAFSRVVLKLACKVRRAPRPEPLPRPSSGGKNLTSPPRRDGTSTRRATWTRTGRRSRRGTSTPATAGTPAASWRSAWPRGRSTRTASPCARSCRRPPRR